MFFAYIALHTHNIPSFL